MLHPLYCTRAREARPVTSDSTPQIFGSGPVLPVPDVDAAIRWYMDRLAFNLDLVWGEPPRHGSVKRDRVCIQFTRTPDGGRHDYRGWTYIWIERIDDYFADVKARGATITDGLESHPWGMREFQVEDPWGHRIRFGQYVEG